MCRFVRLFVEGYSGVPLIRKMVKLTTHTHTHTHTHIYIYIYLNKLSMVENLLITRKTCRPREGVGMFII